MCSTKTRAHSDPYTAREEAEGARFCGWAARELDLPMLGQIALVDNLIRLIELGSSGPHHPCSRTRPGESMDGVTLRAMRPSLSLPSLAALAWRLERSPGSYRIAQWKLVCPTGTCRCRRWGRPLQARAEHDVRPRERRAGNGSPEKTASTWAIEGRSSARP